MKISLSFVHKASAVIIATVLALMAMLLGAFSAFADHSPYGSSPIDKVILCHWSNGNGYEALEVAISSSGAPQGGHDSHQGKIDIIPPYHWQDGENVGTYPGQNWTSENETFWAGNGSANRCEALTQPTTVDVGVTKSIDDATPDVGQQITYTITVTNVGTTDATGVTVADALPSGLAFVSSNASVGSYSSNTWTVGNLNDGISATLTIVATVTGSAGQVIVNTATVDATETDMNSSNDSDSAELTVNTPAGPTTGVLSIVKIVTGQVALPSAFSFTVDGGSAIAFESDGQNDLTLTAGAYTVAEVPALGYTSALSGGCDADGNVTVAANATTTCTITNTVIPPSNVDLAVEKTVDDATPDEGQTVTYTITVTNNSQTDATGVTVTDVLETGLTFGSASTSVGSFGSGVWNVGNLAGGASATLEITATVDAETAGQTLTNTATADATETDSDGTNDSDSVDVVVNNPQSGPNRYTLTLETSGEGDGLVLGNGINCDSNFVATEETPINDCEETYDEGTNVDLTVTPDEGSSFDGSWVAPGAGTCTGTTTPCQVTMNSNINLNAHFSLVQTTTTTGGGGGGGGGRRNNNDDDDGEVLGEVLGEQVAAVPAGAPNTGAGGTASLALFALMAGAAALGYRKRA